MSEIDSLEIKISAEAQSTSKTLDSLITKLDKLSASLGNVSSGGLGNLADGVSKLGTSMQSMNNVKTADFTRLANNISKLGNINSASISYAADSIGDITKALSGIGAVSKSAEQVGQLSSAISKLGYKSVGNAITNIPQLATAMRDLMQTLSTAPKVSNNLIQMTNALANFASMGSRVGSSSRSLVSGLNSYSAGADRATKSSMSLARAFGKFYASWWLVIRGFNQIKKAIDISADLTEVQNVVDVTFGDMAYKVEEFAKTSIEDFGMSELALKQYSSRFQAMGSAMGINNDAIRKSNDYLHKMTGGYIEAGGSMADMSLNLTKLTADMSSFYNVSQEDVAKDLEAIFTGQTRPLRTYGLDLTQATLAEWAMKQGLDANVQSMSQAEKTLLRYQYVLANTTDAHGDFERTMGTWANQTRILSMQLQQLGSVIGETFINALKPALKAMNQFLANVIQFAQNVGNALGKIFGWKYEVSGGGLTEDIDGAASGADDLASGLGDAASNAKKLKTHLLGIDELNVVEPQQDTASGGGGTGGIGGGAGGSGAVGNWVKDETPYESWIDSLYELGEYIGQTLTDAMNNIDWQSIYERARNFGTGLAEFLNGLISPELFGALGQTIAGSLNTALNFLNSFGETFDWYEFGESIATGVNRFFETFDFGELANTIDTWVQGVWETLRTAILNIKWGKVFDGIFEFVDELDLSTIFLLAIPNIGKITKTLGKLENKFISLAKYTKAAIGTFIGYEASVKTLTTRFPKLGKAIDVVGDSFQRLMFGFHYGDIGGGINAAITNIRNNLTGFQKGVIGAVSVFSEFKVLKDSFYDISMGTENLVESISKIGITAGISSAALYTAFGPAGIAVSGITALVSAIMGINKAFEEQKEIEIFGGKLSDLTSKINETSNAIKSRAEASLEFVNESGIAEATMASDLADKYFDLAEKENLTNEEKQKMQNLAKMLSDTLPSLEEYYNTETGLLDTTRESVEKLIETRLREIQLKAAEEKLVEAYKEQYDALENLQSAIEPANNAQERMNDLNREYQELTNKLSALNEYDQLSQKIQTTTGNTETLLQRQQELWNEITDNGENTNYINYDNLIWKLSEVETEMQLFKTSYDEAMGSLANAEEAYTAVGNNIETLTTMMTDGMIGAANNSIAGYANTINADETMKESIISQAEGLLNAFAETQKSHSPSQKFAELAKDSVDGYNLGINKNTNLTITTITKYANTIINKLSIMRSGFYNAGVNAMQGLLNGLSSMEGAIYAKARSIADNVSNAIKSALKIHSPSMVMFNLGEFTMEGFLNGIESLYDKIADSVMYFGEAISVSYAPEIGSVYDYKNYLPIYKTPNTQSIWSETRPDNDNSETNMLLRELINAVQEGKDISINVDGREIINATDRARARMGYPLRAY